MQIITDRAGWRNAIENQKCYDFFHTYEYHALDNNGEPTLFVFENDGEKLCLPLILRSIEGTPYFDLTSVYGYGGSLFNVESPSEVLIRKAGEELEEYAFDNNIISAFSRLHTLIPDSAILPGHLGEIVSLNRTVYIPTYESELDQLAGYAPVLRRQLQHIVQSGVTCRLAQSLDDWMAFYHIYICAMEQKQAPDEYFFSSSFFMGIKDARDFGAELLLAEFDGEIIAGALFTKCGDIAQYFLGAVLPERRELSPLKLLIHQGRIIATEKEVRYFHLGGGKNGIDDGLFQFKSAFSHHFTTFKIWRWIVDEDIYNHLAEGLPEGRFPRYRNLSK